MEINGLDVKDNQIVALLQQNARLTCSEIGEKVGLSRTAVKNRMTALEKFGIIKGYTAIVDPHSSPEMMTFISTVETEPGAYDQVAELLKGEKCVVTLYLRYTAVFSPVFVDAEKDMWRRYKDYLLLLQGKFQEKLQFCFDPNFYPSVLGNITPSERYALYCNIHKQHPAWHDRTEKFALVANGNSENTFDFDTNSEEHSEFVSKFFGENTAEASMLQDTFLVDVHYTCSSIFDMLNL